MTGIDHTLATLDQREGLAFTFAQAHQAMQKVTETYGVNGCVIVSTCNRTELWISEEDDRQTDVRKILCALKEVSLEEYTHYLLVREGMEAITHLFETTSGLKSQIWGEDQILAQIKTSLDKAREAGTTDEILEKLFQNAVTAAKKIKTNIKLNPLDASVATRALEAIQEQLPCLPGLDCLVIGNGEMGRKIATLLSEMGAAVTITLRQNKCNLNLVPEGCRVISYDERLTKLKQAALIVSATSSPHFTLKLEETRDILCDGRKRLLVDLAVPRDIDPAVGSCPGVGLLDMDKLGISCPEPATRKSFWQAKNIIDDQIQEFIKWEKMRNCLPLINQITSATTDKIVGNFSQAIEDLGLDRIEIEVLAKILAPVTSKAIKDILYGLKDKIDHVYWEECFSDLHKAVKK